MSLTVQCPWAVLFLVCSIAVAANAQANSQQSESQPTAQTSSLLDALHRAGQKPLHIFYVHGMSAEGAGASADFQNNLCKHLRGCRPAGKPVREYADYGSFQPNAPAPPLNYLGESIWRDSREWSASDPFVDHYVLSRDPDGPVIVHEINWWPLVFPLKCRKIMAGEANLAGPSKHYLELCSKSVEDPDHPGRFQRYAWISSEEVAKLMAKPSRGALLNRSLKSSLMDWGFSDALMAVGPLRKFLQEGILDLIFKSVRFQPNGQPSDIWEQAGAEAPEYVIISHSLGSYLVLSLLDIVEVQTKAPLQPRPHAARHVFERTSLIYFLANQVPLLELAGLSGGREAFHDYQSWIIHWRDLRLSPKIEPQIIAWSDPSDLLSFYIPEIQGVKVRNLEIQNSIHWLWLFEWPKSAHTNYAKKREVIKVMLGATAEE